MTGEKKPQKPATANGLKASDCHALALKLLDWYRVQGRDLPWRVKGGAHENAYAVWISEIMLQQTTVKTVIDYFDRWMKRFPTLKSLADADIHDVLLMWQGLGYYTRAKKVHECARVLVEKYGGKFPQNREDLLKLPGIGPYTSSSICAFAFNKPETVVDGNVIRVIARLYGITNEIDKNEIYDLASTLTPANHGADYASAIMDLGATVCTPNNPKCKAALNPGDTLAFDFVGTQGNKQTAQICDCPWVDECIAYRDKLTSVIPLIKKPVKQNRTGILYLIQNKDGAFYIQKRAGKGLLSGLYEFPWHYENEAPLMPQVQDLGTIVTHTFTHFHLTLKIVKASINSPDVILSAALQTQVVNKAANKQGDTEPSSVPTDTALVSSNGANKCPPSMDGTGVFVQKQDLKNYAFPTLMKKVFKYL